MATQVTHRLKLVVQPKGIRLSGDMVEKETLVPMKDGADPTKLSRIRLTKAVEAILAKVSEAAFRMGFRPMNVEITIEAPQRLEYGFQRYGTRVIWPAPQPTVVPNPKARARKAKQG